MHMLRKRRGITSTFLSVCAHLFEDDHADAMDALGSIDTARAANMVPIRRAGVI